MSGLLINLIIQIISGAVGGNVAASAAKALLAHSNLTAKEIAEASLKIAG